MNSIQKLRSNPFYIPNEKQSEDMWRVEENERYDREEKERLSKKIVYNVPPIHDNSIPVHKDIKKSRKRK